MKAEVTIKLDGLPVIKTMISLLRRSLTVVANLAWAVENNAGRKDALILASKWRDDVTSFLDHQGKPK